MAAKKGKSRRQGWMSKVMNAGLIALGFSRVIELAFQRNWKGIIGEATFGFSDEGKFNLRRGLRMYTPAGAAIALGTMKRYLLKHFPVR